MSQVLQPLSAPSVPIVQRTLCDWLDYQQSVHPHGIELGLDRVREVWQRLGSPRPAPIVITVGGTNGKGSTVAFLDAMLGAHGCRVGTYTSPHLLRYNERVHVAGSDVHDEALIAAFERIEAARGCIALTYFEFGTLAALLVFEQSALDVAVLEVGLGGRLDAVNIIDADVAIVTTVDLDHQDWLGNDIERIACEKAGIFRKGRIAVIGDSDAPAALLDVAQSIGAQAIVAGREFFSEPSASGWRWRQERLQLDLPDPGLCAPCQRSNAAAAIAAVHALRERIGWNPAAIASGVATARLPARMQRFIKEAELLVDVAHNPQAARVLAAWLRAHPATGADIAVFAALGDKDIEGIAAPMRDLFSHWCLAGLGVESPRGLDVSALRARLGHVLRAEIVSTCSDVEAALSCARTRARAGDRIVAFGSFFVAAVALDVAQRDGFDEI